MRHHLLFAFQTLALLFALGMALYSVFGLVLVLITLPAFAFTLVGTFNPRWLMTRRACLFYVNLVTVLCSLAIPAWLLYLS